MDTAVHFSSATDDWATPQKTFDDLHVEFGFVLDPCASSSNHKCPTWYGLDHPNIKRRNGLDCDWVEESSALGGAVWVNPPYGREIKKWVRKAYESAEDGATVVMLVPARTDTAWFQDWCLPHEVRFIRGRLKFGNATNSAPFPSAIVVMSNKDKGVI